MKGNQTEYWGKLLLLSTINSFQTSMSWPAFHATIFWNWQIVMPHDCTFSFNIILRSIVTITFLKQIIYIRKFTWFGRVVKFTFLTVNSSCKVNLLREVVKFTYARRTVFLTCFRPLWVRAEHSMYLTARILLANFIPCSRLTGDKPWEASCPIASLFSRRSIFVPTINMITITMKSE